MKYSSISLSSHSSCVPHPGRKERDRAKDFSSSNPNDDINSLPFLYRPDAYSYLGYLQCTVCISRNSRTEKNHRESLANLL